MNKVLTLPFLLLLYNQALEVTSGSPFLEPITDFSFFSKRMNYYNLEKC